MWLQVSPLFWGLAIALLLRAMVIETFYVPSGSMLPTLLIGDHVIVNKFTYGARVPLVGWRLPAVRDPERGEVAIFELGTGPGGRICPSDRCPELRREGFVKRIMGVPGDTLAVREGVVVLNGEPLALAETGDVFRDDAGNRLPMRREDVNGHSHIVLEHPKLAGISLTETTVPEGHYFFMGDNRDNSNDSRVWGSVPRDDLKGPVTIIYWSWNNRGSWLSMLNPMTWFRLLAGETRWSRMGDSVD